MSSWHSNVTHHYREAIYWETKVDAVGAGHSESHVKSVVVLAGLLTKVF